jgi:hypothetical protein
VGGYAFGGPDTAERQAAVAAHWRSGSGEIEYLNGGLAARWRGSPSSSERWWCSMTVPPNGGGT